jgi:hypothetical protein
MQGFGVFPSYLQANEAPLAFARREFLLAFSQKKIWLKCLVLQHAFSVIRSAGSNTTNIINPVRRDVVSIGGENDDVLIRFTTVSIQSIQNGDC